MGRLSLSIAFMIEHIPRFVADPIEHLVFGKHESEVDFDLARVELGLKQAFLLADKDQSGSISVSEVSVFTPLKNDLLMPAAVLINHITSRLLSIAPRGAQRCRPEAFHGPR